MAYDKSHFPSVFPPDTDTRGSADSGDLLRLVIIIGSTRAGRFGDTVARWIAGEARGCGAFELDIIDLAEVDLPSDYTFEVTAEVRAYRSRLEAADAYIIVTPEYNHSFPAALKQAIDLAYGEWRAKPLGFVCYGGRGRGIRAVEQLRQVFADLHVMCVRDIVDFHDVWESFGEDGQPADGPGSARAARRMLDQLKWWAMALRYARDFMPYGSVGA